MVPKKQQLHERLRNLTQHHQVILIMILSSIVDTVVKSGRRKLLCLKFGLVVTSMIVGTMQAVNI